MANWSNWYRVTKRCGRPDRRYVYDQSTRRVGGKTETRNRYIGIVGEPGRAYAHGDTNSGKRSGAAATPNIIAALQRLRQEGGSADKRSLESRNAYAATELAQSLGFNRDYVFNRAMAEGVELQPWLDRLDAETDVGLRVGIGAAMMDALWPDASAAARRGIDAGLEEPDPFEREMSERAARTVEAFGQEHPDYNGPWAKYWRAYWHNSESIAAHPDEPRYRLLDIDEGVDFGEGKTFTADEAVEEMNTVYAYDWDEDAMGKPMSEAALEDYFGVDGQDTIRLVPVPKGSPIVAAKPTGAPLPPKQKPIELTYLQDPGHGWLMVPRAVLESVGLSPADFSGWSYVKGHMFALEEDGDMGKFLARAKERGLLVERRAKHVDGQAEVRNWDPNDDPDLMAMARAGRAAVQAAVLDRLDKDREAASAAKAAEASQKASALKQELGHFTGTEHWYRSINRAVTYTDGVKYFADKAGAHWLLDILALEMPSHVKAARGLVFVKAVSDGHKAKLTAQRDSSEPPVWEREIDVTDLPAGEWDLWMGEGGPDGTNVIMLPSEY